MIVSQFDKKYLEWGKILTKTSGEKLPNHKLFLSTVNLNDQDIEQLTNLHHDIIITNEIIDEKSVPKVKTRNRWGGTVGNHMPEFMACRKAKVLSWAFKKFLNEELFIMTDADVFINKGFSFEEEMGDDDALLLVGEDPSPTAVGQGFHNQIRSGVMALKNNLACKALVDSWVNSMNVHNKIDKIEKGHWFWDQVTLKITVEELISRKILKIRKLPHENFINSSFDKDAYMWSAHTGGEKGKKNSLKHFQEKANINKYRISVVTPCWGRPEQTKISILKLLNQNINNWEAFIIGDGCPEFKSKILTDEEILKKIQERRLEGNSIIFKNNPEHKGGWGYSIINYAIRNALGKYFLFGANDDEMANDHFEHYLSEIEGTDYDFVYYNTFIRSSKQDYIRVPQLIPDRIGHAELIIKTDFLKKMPPTEAFYGHDWKLIVDMLEAKAKNKKSKSARTTYIVGGTPADRPL